MPRNLNEWFWELVKNGNVDFPKLPGEWIAVETMSKPKFGEKYKSTPMTTKLGLSDRFNVTWNDANKAIQDRGRSFLSEAGLGGSTATLTMPEALEWNLLANREGWGATDTYEWTNTESRGRGDPRRVVVGLSGGGGAAEAGWAPPDHCAGHVGFRVAVKFRP